MKVLKWPGSKWSIADEIIQIMPKHKIYLKKLEITQKSYLWL